MLREFREFAFKGNFLEVAVGLVLGLAFTAVVTALVNGVLMPLIAAAVGEPNFNEIEAKVGEATIEIGRVLTALVNFLLIAFVLFLVVKGANRLRRREPESAAPTEEVVLLREIRDVLARR